MLPWKYTTNFDTQKHLFYKLVDTNYVIETFICKCGNKNFIIKYPHQSINYTCPICKNKNFYDANLAWKNIHHFTYLHKNLKLKYIYDDVYIEKSKIKSRCVISIPNGIDFLEEKVIFSKKEIFSIWLSNDGDIEESYELEYDNEVFLALKNGMEKYLSENATYLNIPTTQKHKITLDSGAFFLKNKHLKSYEFYYWENTKLLKDEITINQALQIVSNNRKEKSVKKAVYKNFLDQLDNGIKYNYDFVMFFTKKIKDPNLLVKFLKLELYHIYLDSDEKQCMMSFFNFLQEYYTDKQILNLFSKLNYHTKTIFFDMIISFCYCDYKYVIKDEFQKTKCTIEALYEHFEQIGRKYRYKDIYEKTLYYKENKIKPCVDIKGYQIKLPKSGKELVIWANILHNYIAIYFDRIQNDKTTIYGFFKNNNLIFTVEINDKKLIQASRKYNHKLKDDEQKVLNIWLKKFL